MKNSDTCIDRLIMLAKHLDNGDLFEDFIRMPRCSDDGEPPIMELQGGIVIAHFTFPIKELPYLFREWTFNLEKEAVLQKYPDISTVDSVMKFFGLTPGEFMHLFVPFGQITKKYRGKVLTYEAIPEDVAENIFSMVGSFIQMN